MDNYYNPDSQRSSVARTAGDYRNYTYDNEGELITAVGREAGGTTNRLQEQLSYAYDAAGNLHFRTNNALVETFNVNTLNELTTATNAGTLTVAGTTTSPATNVTVNGSAANLYADSTFALGGFTVVNGDNTFTAIAMDSYGRIDSNSVTVNLPATNSFVYDLNGNLCTNGARIMVWNDENELTGVWVANVWSNSFAYDGKMRRRIEMDYSWNGSSWVETNEIHFIYDGNAVIQERDQNNTPKVTYTRGNDLSGTLQGAGGIGGMLARTDNGLVSAGSLFAQGYYHADGNGNITAMIYTNQLFAAKYLYDPFGNTLSMSGPLASANVYRFSSKEWNDSAGIYYFGRRYYDPIIIRWPNRDPIGEEGGINLYAYVGNNPINYFDPLGLLSKCECDALRAQIYSKALGLLKDLRKYDPVADAIGGDPKPGGGVTVPGGHYVEIKQRQHGVKNDMARYVKECINNNNDNNPSIPQFVDEMANRTIPTPFEPPPPYKNWFQPLPYNALVISPLGGAIGSGVGMGIGAAGMTTTDEILVTGGALAF